MQIRDGPAAVIPPFFIREGTFLAIYATVQVKRDGKAAEKVGESEDLPE